MELDGITPLQSPAEVAQTGQQPHRNALENKARPRHQFNRVFNEEDGVVYQMVTSNQA
jgi:hypothetical protein